MPRVRRAPTQPRLKRARLGSRHLFGAPEVPKTVSGLRLWLAARKETGYADGNGVATPINWSGLGNTLTQATGSQQPTYQTSVLDGQPIFRFTIANSQFWSAASGDIVTVTNAASGLTLFVVAKVAAFAGVSQQFFNLDNGLGSAQARFKFGHRFVSGNPDEWYASGRRLDADAQINVTAGADVDTNWNLHTAVPDWANGQVSFYRAQTLDGTVAWTTSGTTSATNSSIAAVGSKGGTTELLNGDIAEMLVYDRVLAAGERQAVWDYLVGVYPSLVPSGVSGAAQGQQRTQGIPSGQKQAAAAAQGAIRASGITAGGKQAVGAAQGAARIAGVVVSGRVATAAASGQQHTSGSTAGRKQATGTAVGATRTSGATTGIKGAVGAASGLQRTTGQSVAAPAGPTAAQTGQQRTSGVSSGVKAIAVVTGGQQRTASLLTGARQTQGAATGQQRSTGRPAAAKATSGATGAAQRTAGLSTRFIPPSAAAQAAQRASGTSAGRKGTAAGALGGPRTSGLSVGIHRTAGGAGGQQRTAGVGGAAKGGRGTAVGSQRVHGVMEFTTVPPPRWVEADSGASGQIEGASGSTGQVEAVLVGAGIVEGTGGV
jgi:hypothetical protein